jgi:hypothetical protein
MGMKRIVVALVLVLIAPALFAGATYKFRSVTTGVASQTLEGTVKTDGAKIRMEMTAGDGVLFKNGSVVVSNDGGKTLNVTDKATKSYYQLDLTDLLGGASSVTKQFGDLVKFDVKNAKVDVKHAGSVGAVEGFPAQRSTVDSSYELVVNAMGQNMSMKTKNATELWWTDKVPASYTNALQQRGIRTGIDAIDKMLQAQTSSIKGFPLKQVTTTTVTMNGQEMKTTTTSTVSAFKEAKFADAEFVIPAGYTKTQNPIEKMMGRFGK